MNSRCPSSVTATNGREPFVATLAGSTEVTGNPLGDGNESTAETALNAS